MKYGYNKHRLKDNPAEKIYLEYVNKNFSSIALNGELKAGLSQIVNSKDASGALIYLSDKEETIVLSVLQWLGSPVGQGMISECQDKIDEL